MLRPWPVTLAVPVQSLALTTLALLVACSSAGVPGVETDTLSTGPVDTGGESTVSEELTGNTATSPTTTLGGTDGPTGDVSTSTDVPSTSNATEQDSTGQSASDTDTGTSTGGTSTGTDTSTSTDTGSSSSSGGSSSTGEPLPGCMDGVQNQDETDVDCGGSCPACEDELACLVDADCISLSCSKGVCVAAACDDGKKDGGETDIDCGGDCPDACGDGEGCADPSDCGSGVCDADVCAPAACDDTVQNAEETDVDCGGPDCDACGTDAKCEIAGDCLSGVCTANKCVAPSCNDAIKNGGETQVDCGGPDCMPCKLQTLIINEVDYDQIGTDAAEFIEVFNFTGAPVNLTGLQVLLVNGSANPAPVYTTVNLGNGVLANDSYLVIGPAGFAVPPGVTFVQFAVPTNAVQNGNPDGIALVDSVNKVVLDALSYGGAITMANLGAIGTKTLVEGTALPANVIDSNANAGSLARIPNGNDTNDAASDWAFTKNVTPGAANKP